MHRLWPTLSVLTLMIGCASAKTRFDPSSMSAPSPTAQPDYREPLSVQEIEQLTPQLQFPITLAVSQPTSGQGWNAEELRLIESWQAPLQTSGFVKELVILPESLSDSCGWRMSYHCGVQKYRTAAARFRADALLLISLQTDLKQSVTPLSILNLTIVGLWIVPAHQRSATTILEGSLIDNRNEYLYVFARATGQSKIVRPYFYADWHTAADRSRLAALRAFGDRMIAQVNEAKNAPGK